ncbi:hypothetical protein Ciccas_004042 [Cichlidogyrus casuarinus]|uniref:Uncharacterized protein n=1 Tax=Cichlidogyrus casuarinus TaxID=1844966 RepID=A0ABD2QCN9_9PLAT
MATRIHETLLWTLCYDGEPAIRLSACKVYLDLVCSGLVAFAQQHITREDILQKKYRGNIYEYKRARLDEIKTRLQERIIFLNANLDSSFSRESRNFGTDSANADASEDFTYVRSIISNLSSNPADIHKRIMNNKWKKTHFNLDKDLAFHSH